MKKITRISQYIIAYASWAIFILLFLVILLLGRETWLAALRNYWARDNLARQYSINFLDRVFVLIVGITWLILMLVIESYFRNGITKGNLIHRVSTGLGYEILVIFLIHLAMTWMVGITAQPITRWIVLVLELVIGGGLIITSRKTAKKPTKKVENT
jgi:hypothetical protein